MAPHNSIPTESLTIFLLNWKYRQNQTTALGMANKADVFRVNHGIHPILYACKSMVYDKQIFCSFASASLEKMPARKRSV